jgi:preprotein translocase subunit YajC
VQFLIVMALLLVVMWVLMIRPQRQRQRQHQTMIDAAGVGDDILTTGGIYGTIAEADGDDIVVELAERLTVHMTRRGIAAVLPPEDDDELEQEDEPAEIEAIVDETSEEDLSAEELRERTREGAV